MPKVRRDRCDKYRFDDDKRRCVLAWGLMVNALGTNYSLEDLRSRFTETPKGKPYFDGISECINVSHSGDKVICVLSDSEVGCDVETKTKDALKIAGRFFAKEEFDFLRSIEDGTSQDREFLKLWTLKEAFVKAKGVGISYPFSSIVLMDKNGEYKSQVCDEKGDVYSFANVDDNDGYSYSVCRKGSTFCNTCVYVGEIVY